MICEKRKIYLQEKSTVKFREILLIHEKFVENFFEKFLQRFKSVFTFISTEFVEKTDSVSF